VTGGKHYRLQGVLPMMVLVSMVALLMTVVSIVNRSKGWYEAGIANAD